jgi:hypothetical protein
MLAILAPLLANRYTIYAALIALAAAGYGIWLHEHTQAALIQAQAQAIARNVAASNEALAQLQAQKDKVQTVVQTVTKRIYVHPSTSSCAAIPAIRDALAGADQLRRTSGK